jgi:hypothetical protein
MNPNTQSDYESEIERDIDDIDMDEVMGCTCGEILNIYNEYGLFSGTCPKCGETWGNPTYELPQDCFNIVKDYMGIVSVPTPVWNELMKIPLKEIKNKYDKPFPKGTDLRKVSKKDKLQRYWCGAIKDKVNWNIYHEHYGIGFELQRVNLARKYQDKSQKGLTLKELRRDFARKARIFHKICIEGDVEDDILYVKPMPHLWGNFEATDLSIVVCMMLMRERYSELMCDKICLGCNDREIFDSIRTYEKRNKIDYHIEKK